MPADSRLTLRLAVLYLVGGAMLGTMVLTGKASAEYRDWMLLFPLHIVWIAIGGMVQFTLGTAFWILPKFADKPSFYGNIAAYRWCIALLNVGIIIYTVNFTLWQFSWLTFLVRLVWIMGAVAGGLHFFPRIKPFQHA